MIEKWRQSVSGADLFSVYSTFSNFCEVLGYVKVLSDMLQSSSLDLSVAVDLVGSLIWLLNHLP